MIEKYWCLRLQEERNKFPIVLQPVFKNGLTKIREEVA